ncbi:hypothetical protein [Roseibium sp. RKSG952]|uniref:hypothetical protein n=1 Tax=Roseibium sp. RKSG952 TaxID=2529384 RepID=UPI0012BD3203|nr:hypothetical protein [Roseibium sp. RKSG952]MTI00163.1 hypothetical protein [Roseibium sp. RKSG952]
MRKVLATLLMCFFVLVHAMPASALMQGSGSDLRAPARTATVQAVSSQETLDLATMACCQSKDKAAVNTNASKCSSDCATILPTVSGIKAPPVLELHAGARAAMHPLAPNVADRPPNNA